MTSLTITRMLAEWEAGDRGALSRIIPLLYEELRRGAAACVRREWRSRTLSSTALVHEAYLALGRGSPVRCNDRSHFTAIVKRLMRQIAIQYARRRGAMKRGGAENEVGLDEGVALSADCGSDLDVETTLERLRLESPRRHLIVEMHYRGGYSVREIAEAVGVSGRTVERELNAGRDWLEEQLATKPWTP